MRSEKKILVAFILNLASSFFEFFGGIYTGSVAIISDSLHDLGDALSIGIAFFLEKKSKRQPDERYTYGYARYSVLGGVITTVILLLGSLAVIYNAVYRIAHPREINYEGMILFAVFGVLSNSLAAFFTHGGRSLNQKAVNLHMLEDVLGWVVVLVGAILMKFTSFALIDPIMSVGVALFILVSAVKGLSAPIELFLEKTPKGIDLCGIKEHLLKIDGVLDIHHIHVRGLDGQNNYATMHVVADGDIPTIKRMIREELREHEISHATLEFESKDEVCHQKHCRVDAAHGHVCHHHH